MASWHDRSMSASRTPRRYVVTKTRCTWSGETACLPWRYSSVIVRGRWHAGVVQVRYRYRLYPSPGQQQALARVFGCARVVYNDCLVRHEVLRERVEVKDHHRRAVAAAR